MMSSVARGNLFSVTTNASHQNLRNLTLLQHAGLTTYGISTSKLTSIIGAAKMTDVAEFSKITLSVHIHPSSKVKLVSITHF